MIKLIFLTLISIIKEIIVLINSNLSKMDRFTKYLKQTLAISLLILVVVAGYTLNKQDDIAPENSEASSNSTSVIIPIDLGSKPNGIIKHNALGFLHSLTDQDNLLKYVDPVYPRLFRSSYTRAVNNYSYVKGFPDTSIQVILSDHYIQEFNPNREPDKWPHNNKDLREKWINRIKHLVNDSIQNNYEIEWDIWNEPDHGSFWTGTRDEYLNLWEEAYRAIRSVDQDALVVGPSLGASEDWIEPFLLFASENNVLPDIFSWHEMKHSHQPTKDISKRVTNINNLLLKYGSASTKIDFNEIINLKYQYSPGTAMHFISEIESNNIRKSAHACWADDMLGGQHSNNCRSDTLNGLLLNSIDGVLSPRPKWWIYKSYNSLKGDYYKINYNEEYKGILNIKDDSIHIIIGRDSAAVKIEESHNVTINLKDLPEEFSQKELKINAYKVPDTNGNILLKPIEIINQSLYSNGELNISSIEVNNYDAVEIILTDSPTTTATKAQPVTTRLPRGKTPTKVDNKVGDLNGDGMVGIKDFPIFVTYYMKGDSKIDFNKNGINKKDIGDFLVFVEEYKKENIK